MAKKEEEKALAPTVTKPSDLMLSRPDFLSKEAPRGAEQIESNDMIMPRLVICQSMTEQRKRSSTSYIEGLQEGDLFNSLTGENYGCSVSFVPLFFYKSRILFKPMDQGGGILCQSPNAKQCSLNAGGPCAHDKWGPNGEPPECTELFNFPSFILKADGQRELVIISFKSTGIKAAKQLNSFIRYRNADTFAGIYRLSTQPDKNNAGQEYFVPAVANAGWVDKELYGFCEAAWEALAPQIGTGAVQMDTSGMAGDNSSHEKVPF
jgi:hypothetical protein